MLVIAAFVVTGSTRVGEVVSVVAVLPARADMIMLHRILVRSLVDHDMWRQEGLNRVEDDCVRLANVFR